MKIQIANKHRKICPVLLEAGTKVLKQYRNTISRSLNDPSSKVWQKFNETKVSQRCKIFESHTLLPLVRDVTERQVSKKYAIKHTLILEKITLWELFAQS